MVDKEKRFIYLLLFSVFAIATCGLIYELVAGTLASYLLGDSVKQFSFIIGIYLFSMGIGSYFAKFIKVDLLNKFIEIEITIGLIGGLSSVILYLLFNYTSSFYIILYLLVSITGCLVGIEIPLLMNILKDKVKFSDLVSNVFTFDYIGALIASIIFPLILIPKLGIVRTSLFFGMINLGVAFMIILNLKEDIKKPFSLKLKTILAFTILFICFIFSNQIVSFSEENLFDEKIVLSKQTLYQKLVITRNKNEYKLFLNNNLQFSTKDEYRYHEALVHPIMSFTKNIEHILVLGGGDGLAVRELLKYKEVKTITLVDLDKDMTELFKSNAFLKRLNENALSNPKLSIINEDAFIWIQKNNKKFNVVIIDFPDPSNYSLGKLYTSKFYKSLTKVLFENAKIVVQTTSPYFAPKSFWCIHNTIQTVFQNAHSYHIYLPSFGEWGYCLASLSNNSSKTIYRKINHLKYYDYDFQSLSHFQQDMSAKNIEINKLDNQVLVRYFDEEWGKL